MVRHMDSATEDRLRRLAHQTAASVRDAAEGSPGAMWEGQLLWELRDHLLPDARAVLFDVWRERRILE